MNPVRFGLIGCSSIARRRFVPALAGLGVARLEHVGSRDPARRRQFAETWGCSKYGSYDDVIADPDVDAVYISTPPALHEPWARVAARHRKHILCEKPAFTNYGTALELVELCRRSGVRLMEGYMFRYHPQHAAVMALLNANRIGAPRVIQSEFAFPEPASGSFRLQPELGGGVFLDAGGYPVAIAMLLFKDFPTSVYCQIRADQDDVERSVSMVLEFPGDRLAHTLAIYGACYRSSYLVLGSRGSIQATRAFAVPPEMKTELILETAAGQEIIPVAPADQFQLMIQDFCAQITQSGPASQTFEHNLLRQHAVMEAARCSNARQKPILISEIESGRI